MGGRAERQDKCWTWKTFTLPDVEENSQGCSKKTANYSSYGGAGRGHITQLGRGLEAADPLVRLGWGAESSRRLRHRRQSPLLTPHSPPGRAGGPGTGCLWGWGVLSGVQSCCGGGGGMCAGSSCRRRCPGASSCRANGVVRGWFPAYRSARNLKDIVFLKNNIHTHTRPRRTSKP